MAVEYNRDTWSSKRRTLLEFWRLCSRTFLPMCDALQCCGCPLRWYNWHIEGGKAEVSGTHTLGWKLLSDWDNYLRCFLPLALLLSEMTARLVTLLTGLLLCEIIHNKSIEEVVFLPPKAILSLGFNFIISSHHRTFPPAVFLLWNNQIHSPSSAISSLEDSVQHMKL